MKKAFTLAEIMIVLSVIGVITAILLPTAFHATPDENVMKFKKGNTILGAIVKEFVNNDKYFYNGDLGVVLRSDTGILANDTIPAPNQYFCQVFASMLAIEGTVNCPRNNGNGSQINKGNDEIPAFKTAIDRKCGNIDNPDDRWFRSADGIDWFSAGNSFTFADDTVYTKPGTTPIHTDRYGQDSMYNVICFVVDYDVVDDVNNPDNLGPFAYAIRRDGKIVSGARADAWLMKSTQQRD